MPGRGMFLLCYCSHVQAPLLQSYSVKQRQVLDGFTLRINHYIQGNVSALSHPGVNIQIFDTFSFMMEVFNAPQKFGLVNVSEPCLENWSVFIEGIGGQEARGGVIQAAIFSGMGIVILLPSFIAYLP